MNTLTTVAVVAAIVGSALIGGMFFAFSNFIMKALERMPSTDGMLAMQTINITVLNRWFLGVFTGTALVCLVLAVVAIAGWESAFAPYMVGGAVAYIGGTWMVTGLGNVPLNNRLAAVDPGDPESSRTWKHYLRHWTKLNTRRAAAALLAAVLFSIGLIHA